MSSVKECENKGCQFLGKETFPKGSLRFRKICTINNRIPGNILCPIETVNSCPVCGEIPEVTSLGCRIWIVKHEINDDHLIRVTGKNRDEAVMRWNRMKGDV